MKRRAQVVSDDTLHRQRSWDGNHRERVTRAGGNSGDLGRGIISCRRATKTPQQIISEFPKLYVTEFMGHGANLVTATIPAVPPDLISGGELAYPVEEITVCR